MTLLHIIGIDHLIGGGGEDILQGGGGVDRYAYSRGSGINHIVDSGSNTLQFDYSFFDSGLELGLGSLRLTFTTGPGDEIHLEGFDPNDPYGTVVVDRFEFTECVRLLRDDPVLAEKIASEGRPYVLEHYEWSKVLDRVETWLEEHA